MANNNNEKQFSRRDFLKTTGVATGGIIGGSFLGGLVGFNLDGSSSSEAESETAGESTEGGADSSDDMREARTFISRDEDFRTLEAAVERIYPEDENGPGAVELGVPYFIDRQMGSLWGTNSEEYMKGPYTPSASDTHGRQEKLNRGEMMLLGLRRIQEVSLEEEDAEFQDLDGEVQDQILSSFEANDVEIRGMEAEAFFELLNNVTIEGVYSDPSYGGNKDMQGWKMMEYPGPRMGWLSEIGTDEFLSLDPQSLNDYQGGEM